MLSNTAKSIISDINSNMITINRYHLAQLIKFLDIVTGYLESNLAYIDVCSLFAPKKKKNSGDRLITNLNMSLMLDELNRN